MLASLTGAALLQGESHRSTGKYIISYHISYNIADFQRRKRHKGIHQASKRLGVSRDCLLCKKTQPWLPTAETGLGMSRTLCARDGCDLTIEKISCNNCRYYTIHYVMYTVYDYIFILSE